MNKHAQVSARMQIRSYNSRSEIRYNISESEIKAETETTAIANLESGTKKIKVDMRVLFAVRSVNSNYKVKS